MTFGVDTANQWWRMRSGRERHLLLLLAILALGLVAWYGIASPLSLAAERSEIHRNRAAALLSEVERSRAAIGGMAIAIDTLDDVLMLSATEAGFELEKHDDDAREITVQGRASNPATLFSWIEMLRKNHGLTVANLTVERETDGAALRVEAVFVRGGL